MAKRRKRIKKQRRVVSVKVKAARKKFARAVDVCIIVASKSKAGTRMKTLGQCVKRTLGK